MTGMISMRYSPPSRRQEMLNRLPVGDCIMKSTKSSMFNRRRHLFSPRSVADLDTTAQLLWHVAVKTARRFIAELLTPRSDTSPRRDLHLLSRLEQTHCQPLSNYTQPLMMRANSSATASKPLMCPCRPSRLKKNRHDFFRLREKIVASLSNLPRAPDYTRLQKTAQDSPRPCWNYTWKKKTAHDFRIMANRDQSWSVWKCFFIK